LSIIERWPKKEIERVALIIEKNNVILVSFHIASCFENAPIENGAFQPVGQEMSEAEMLENAKLNIIDLRNKVGFVEIAIENNNFSPTGAYELITEAEFINKLLTKNNLKLLLDLAHAKITAHYRNLPLDKYLKSFNLDCVIQIHISGIRKTGKVYKDAHEKLTDEEWAEFKKIITFCHFLQFVTIEYYREIPILINMLNKLKKIFI
jgi:uncharacterized protein (UPF0276 family)